MKFREFLAAVKLHWRAFVITAAAVLAVGLIWLVLTPAKYVSTTRLMVSVEGATTAAAYQNDQVVAGRVNTYVALLTSDVVNQRVIDKLGLPETPRELAGEVSATIVPPHTALIDIAVTDESAERAQSIAQTLAQEFITYAGAMETPTGDDGQKVHTAIVSAASPPHKQSGERFALGGLSALAALMLGAAAVWIRSTRDPVLQRTIPDAATADVTSNDTTPTAPPQAIKATTPIPQPADPDTDAPHAAGETAPPKTIDVLDGYRLQTGLRSKLRRPADAAGAMQLGEQPGAVPADFESPTTPTAPPQAVKATAPIPQPARTDTTDPTPTDTDTTDTDTDTTDTDTTDTETTDTTDTDTDTTDAPHSDTDTTDAPHSAGDAPHSDTDTTDAPHSAGESAPPKTVNVLDGYRRLQTGLRSMADRSRRTLDARRDATDREMSDAAPSAVRVETSSPTDLEAAKPRERTPWLLGFLCVLIPIMPSYVVPAGPLKSNGSPGKLIAVLLFGLAVLGFALIRRAASTRTVQPGLVIILFYFFLELLVYGVGVLHPGSAVVDASRTRVLINLVANVGVALYVLARVQTTRQRNIILGCLATGLAFACLAALLQSLTHIDLRFFFKPPGFVINTEDLDLAARSGVKRVVGTSPHPIEFSILAAVTVPLTIYLARNAVKRTVRWAAVLACGLALVSMPGAVSRTGVIALAVALVVYMWNFTIRQIAIAIGVGSVMIVSYSIVQASIASALWGSITGAREDDSIQSRIADYVQVSRTFREHPLFGLGLGGSPPSEYGLLDNEWLQAIVQGGLIGVTAMILLVVGGIFGFSAALRRATTRAERDQAYALGSMFIAIVVCTFTFDLFSFQQSTRILFIVFALLWSSFTVSLSQVSEDDTRPSPVEADRPVELSYAGTKTTAAGRPGLS